MYVPERIEAVVDGIMRTFVGLVLSDGRMVIAGWNEIEPCA